MGAGYTCYATMKAIIRLPKLLHFLRALARQTPHVYDMQVQHSLLYGYKHLRCTTAFRPSLLFFTRQDINYRRTFLFAGESDNPKDLRVAALYAVKESKFTGTDSIESIVNLNQRCFYYDTV